VAIVVLLVVAAAYNLVRAASQPQEAPGAGTTMADEAVRLVNPQDGETIKTTADNDRTKYLYDHWQDAWDHHPEWNPTYSSATNGSSQALESFTFADDSVMTWVEDGPRLDHVEVTRP
jgi:hypothetical protein